MSEALLRERFEKLSIFFPMWNEEQYIHRAVRAAQEVCEQLVEHKEIGDYEIIVVDDASTDRTAEYADELTRVDTHIRVVHHQQNRKLGGSIKTGLAAATGDLVLYTDADLPFEMVELVRAIRVLRDYEADMISAYRFDRTGEGLRRAVYSWTYNWLIQLAFGTRLRDVNFAFKLCRRRVLDHVTLSSEGSFIDAELVVRAQRAGFCIVQIGVDYFPRTRGVSTLSSPAVIKGMLTEMVRLRKELRSVRPVAAASTARPPTARPISARPTTARPTTARPTTERPADRKSGTPPPTTAQPGIPEQSRPDQAIHGQSQPE